MLMRDSTRRWRSLAAWYSAFSRRSPSSRARLISFGQLELQLVIEGGNLVLELLDQTVFHRLGHDVWGRSRGAVRHRTTVLCFGSSSWQSQRPSGQSTRAPSRRWHADHHHPAECARRAFSRRGAGRRRRSRCCSTAPIWSATRSARACESVRSSCSAGARPAGDSRHRRTRCRDGTWRSPRPPRW